MMLPFWLACTWISQADLEDQLLQVDDDADGVTVAEGDCDDEDPQIYPDAEDIWYDGIDADCAGNDDFDQDGDGDRPLDYSGGDCDDENPELNSFDLDGDLQTTCDGDCDDQDPFTFMGAAYEELSDRCMTDQDGDGWGSPEKGEDILPGTDCDDQNPGIHPGAEEVWYDGVDSDCGQDDDYDQDGDSAQHESSGVDAEWADCDDEDPSIYPTADEIWYDGVDSDCKGNDDYDQDGDGVRHASAKEELVDCDDQDASSYPGADEDLSDEVDHDCDGGAASFVSEAVEVNMSAGRAFELSLLDGTPLLSLVASELTFGKTTWYEKALGFYLDDTDPHVLEEPLSWYSSSTTDVGVDLASSLDMIVVDDVIYGIVGTLSNSRRYLELIAYSLTEETHTKVSLQQTGTSLDSDLESMSLAMDASGTLHVLACASTPASIEGILYMQVRLEDLAAGVVTDSVYLDYRSDSCDLRIQDAEAFTGAGDSGDTGVVEAGPQEGIIGLTDQEGLRYLRFLFDPTDRPGSYLNPPDFFQLSSEEVIYQPASLQFPPTEEFTELFADPARGQLLLRQGALRVEIPTSMTPVSTRLVERDDVYYVTWTEADGSVHLAWGELGSGSMFSKASMSVSFAATRAIPWVSADGSTLGIIAASEDQLALSTVPLPGGG